MPGRQKYYTRRRKAYKGQNVRGKRTRYYKVDRGGIRL